MALSSSERGRTVPFPPQDWVVHVYLSNAATTQDPAGQDPHHSLPCSFLFPIAWNIDRFETSWAMWLGRPAYGRRIKYKESGSLHFWRNHANPGLLRYRELREGETNFCLV